MKVGVKKASDARYEEIRLFKTTKDFFDWLRKTYTRWIIFFKEDEDFKGYRGFENCDLIAMIYDDYIE
jgi:hypothetical protein